MSEYGVCLEDTHIHSLTNVVTEVDLIGKEKNETNAKQSGQKSDAKSRYRGAVSSNRV